MGFIGKNSLAVGTLRPRGPRLGAAPDARRQPLYALRRRLRLDLCYFIRPDPHPRPPAAVSHLDITAQPFIRPEPVSNRNHTPRPYENSLPGDPLVRSRKRLHQQLRPNCNNETRFANRNIPKQYLKRWS